MPLTSPLAQGLFGATPDQLTDEQRRFMQTMTGLGPTATPGPTTSFAPYEPSPVAKALRNWQYLPDDQQFLLRQLGVDPAKANPQDYVPQHREPPTLQQAPTWGAQMLDDLSWYSQFALPGVGTGRVADDFVRTLVDHLQDQHGVILGKDQRYLHGTGFNFEHPSVSTGPQDWANGLYMTTDFGEGPRLASNITESGGDISDRRFHPDWQGRVNMYRYTADPYYTLDAAHDAAYEPEKLVRLHENLRSAPLTHEEDRAELEGLLRPYRTLAEMPDEEFLKVAKDPQLREMKGMNTILNSEPTTPPLHSGESRDEYLLGEYRRRVLRPAQFIKKVKNTLGNKGFSDFMRYADFRAISDIEAGAGGYPQINVFDPRGVVEPYYKPPGWQAQSRSHYYKDAPPDAPYQPSPYDLPVKEALAAIRPFDEQGLLEGKELPARMIGKMKDALRAGEIKMGDIPEVFQKRYASILGLGEVAGQKGAVTPPQGLSPWPTATPLTHQQVAALAQTVGEWHSTAQAKDLHPYLKDLYVATHNPPDFVAEYAHAKAMNKEPFLGATWQGYPTKQKVAAFIQNDLPLWMHPDQVMDKITALLKAKKGDPAKFFAQAGFKLPEKPTEIDELMEKAFPPDLGLPPEDKSGGPAPPPNLVEKLKNIMAPQEKPLQPLDFSTPNSTIYALDALWDKAEDQKLKHVVEYLHSHYDFKGPIDNLDFLKGLKTALEADNAGMGPAAFLNQAGYKIGSATTPQGGK